eukprot:928791-Prorocentrum_minimum.AAC.1
MTVFRTRTVRPRRRRLSSRTSVWGGSGRRYLRMTGPTSETFAKLRNHAGNYKLRNHAGNYKLRNHAGNYKLPNHAGNYKLPNHAGNYKLPNHVAKTSGATERQESTSAEVTRPVPGPSPQKASVVLGFLGFRPYVGQYFWKIRQTGCTHGGNTGFRILGFQGEEAHMEFGGGSGGAEGAASRAAMAGMRRTSSLKEPSRVNHIARVCRSPPNTCGPRIEGGVTIMSRPRCQNRGRRDDCVTPA